MALAGWLLAIGSVLGFVGAFMPSLYPVFTTPGPERLILISERETAWMVSSLSFASSYVLIAAGLAAFSSVVSPMNERVFAWTGFALFAVGAVLAVAVFMFRITATIDVARSVAAGAGVPDWYTSVSQWVFILLAFSVTSATLSLAAYGVAVVRSEILVSWSGWTLIALAALFIVGTAIVKDVYPVAPHVGTAVLAIGMLINA